MTMMMMMTHQVDEHNTAKLHALSESTGTAIAMIR
jgi:hypothetical protein